MAEHYDVVIIGTGAGGGTLAYAWRRPVNGSLSLSGETTSRGRKTTGTAARSFSTQNTGRRSVATTEKDAHSTRKHTIALAVTRSSTGPRCCVFARRISAS